MSDSIEDAWRKQGREVKTHACTHCGRVFAKTVGGVVLPCCARARWGCKQLLCPECEKKCPHYAIRPDKGRYPDLQNAECPLDSQGN